MVRELERSILEEAGYRVRTAADGQAALAALADARPTWSSPTWTCRVATAWS